MAKAGLVLLIILIAYWSMLSGYFDHIVLLVTGGLSILITIALTWRMKILDWETSPYIYLKAPLYFGWLFKEIVKANMEVVKAVLSPDMEISPKLVKVPMGHKTDLGRVTFANSITLTPGTIAVEMQEGDKQGGKILVHALLEQMTDPSGFVEMGQRAGCAVHDPIARQIGAADKKR